MMEAALSKPDLLLEFLVIALDAPAHLGKINERSEAEVLRQCREPIFGWLLFPFGPLDQQPLWLQLLRDQLAAHRNSFLLRIPSQTADTNRMSVEGQNRKPGPRKRSGGLLSRFKPTRHSNNCARSLHQTESGIEMRAVQFRNRPSTSLRL
jgi:hypothetical protein